MVTKLDFIGVPTQDPARARSFYVETLGLRPDDRTESEAWAGDTCFSIWEPKRFGMPFTPTNNPVAMHVEDVAASRKQLEGEGVQFAGDTLDTGVCHMAFFTDPDGNALMLHSRYAPHQ